MGSIPTAGIGLTTNSEGDIYWVALLARPASHCDGMGLPLTLSGLNLRLANAKLSQFSGQLGLAADRPRTGV